jgi:hypothetical protein
MNVVDLELSDVIHAANTLIDDGSILNGIEAKY